METIVITGTNRGIGLELTKQYLQNGKRVIATCREPKSAESLLELDENKNLNVFQLEITDTNSIDHFSSLVKNDTIDVLINNAGIGGGDQQDIQKMDTEAWIKTFSTNTIAQFSLSVALLKNLKNSNRPRIISVSSQMGSLSRIGSGWYAYRSSKAALNKVMQVMGHDLEKEGIIFCPGHPGRVITDMGGPNAEITVQESASGLIGLINRLELKDSGRFWKWNGEKHPW